MPITFIKIKDFKYQCVDCGRMYAEPVIKCECGSDKIVNQE